MSFIKIDVLYNQTILIIYTQSIYSYISALAYFYIYSYFTSQHLLLPVNVFQ